MLTQLDAQRAELLVEADRLEPAIVESSQAAKQHHATLRALHLVTSRMLRAHQELHDASQVGFGDLLNVIRPSACHLVVSTPRQKKGYLEFENISLVDHLPNELISSHRLYEEVQRHGLDLVFCYANPVPVMPHEHMVDYHPVHLLELKSGDSLLKAMQGTWRYESFNQALRELENESQADVDERWTHVVAEMRNRRSDLPPWGV